MRRRDFLNLAILAAAAPTVGGCATTARYVPPERLTAGGESLLLSNGRLIDVVSGALFDQNSLLIVDGKIAGLFGPEEANKVVADRVIDLEGGYVMPGIINAHVHISLPGGLSKSPEILFLIRRQAERNCEECLKQGVTTIRDMLSMFNMVSELREKIARGEIVGPRIYSASGLDIEGSYGDKMSFSGDRRHWVLVDGPNSGRNAVRLALDSGADLIKLFQQRTEIVLPGKELPTMDVPTIAAIVDEAEKRGSYVAVHQTETPGLHKLIDAGAYSLEHFIRDRLLTPEEVETIADRGITFVPTASAPFALASGMPGDPFADNPRVRQYREIRDRVMPELIKSRLEPQLIESSFKILEEFSDPNVYGKPRLLPWPDSRVFTAGVVVGTDNALQLYRAGVTFGSGNDGGVPFCFHADMWLELMLLQGAGFATADLLKAATINNAKIMRVDDMLGQLAPGKIADLIVTDYNPLDDVVNIKDPRMVFKDGRLMAERPKVASAPGENINQNN